MTISGYIALGVILLMIIALVREILRPGLILFSALVIFMIFDIISAEDALSGFSNKGMITDQAMLDRFLDEYYALHEWDPATGIPRPETLKTLDLADVCKEERMKDEE